MKLLITLLFIVISSYAISQNKIVFKSGEEMNGKIVSLQGNELVFQFKGTNLKLNTNEITSIHFIETEISKNINKNGSLTGVVTYFFNDNYGYKPDIGSKVIIHKTNKENSLNEQFSRYRRAKTYLSLLSYLKKKDSNRVKYETELKKLGINSEEDFKALDKETATQLIGLSSVIAKETETITVDGNGKYSINLTPGFYEVVIQSKGRNDITMTEVRGKIKYETIEISPNEASTIDAKFDI
jgi:predicted  nucleic acid-binding Zn-ribbon protein